MARIYYSRQYFNQLKRKQHEEYLKGQNRYYSYIKKYYGEYLKRKNEYYLYERKYYEEYIKMQNSYYLYKKKYYKEYLKRQNGYFLYKKNYYEEYIKMQNKYYLYEIKIYEEYIKRKNGYSSYKKLFYEEYLKRQNKYYSYEKKYYEEYFKIQNNDFGNKRKYDKTYPSKSEFSNSFKTDSKEANNINDDIIRKNSNSPLEINIEENNLEEKNNDSDKYNNLENKNSTSIKDSYYEEFLVEKDIKRQNDGFENRRNYDKTYPSQSEFSNYLKNGSVEDNNIDDDSKINNRNGSLEITIEENNLEEKNNDSDKYDNLENKNSTSIEDSYNENFLGEEDEDQLDKCNNEICEMTVSHPSDITARLITVKVPVVLTECSITITVQSSIKLEDDILEIKHIRKNAYLNQCELIPNSKNDKQNSGMLFIAGFITSNIEYSTKEHNYKEGLSGKLKHATVNVPFKCTTRVTFNTLPKFKATASQEEVEILQTSIRLCNHHEEEITGRDIREQSFRLIEFFNEKVFCELISAEFIESNILENPTNKKCKSPFEQTFHDINENVVLFLTIQLLQNQDVVISK